MELTSKPQNMGHGAAPPPREREPFGQAEKTTVEAEIVFWGLSASGGLSCDEFQGFTVVPWNAAKLCSF